ncbi:MAG TPA: ARMT1-like domain-containing protein, partial [Anaerolineae bacterium]|nr:ARMT1-like domain-containing protein [Anaerolineae bacterium]
MNDGHLPPPLMTSEPGSFARATIVERKPAIIGQVLLDNDYPPEIEAALAAFREEIAHHPIQPLSELAPDVTFWNRTAARHHGKGWLELPWFFAETYFYRRLLEVVRYFQAGPWQGHDPFALQKRNQEREALAWLESYGAELQASTPEAAFQILLHSCLWGNRADLSNLTVRERAQGGLATHQERHNILIDDTEHVLALLSRGVRRLGLITDNAGRELVFDLALADFLLAQEWARSVVLYLKGQPFFVSDATVADARRTIGL